MAIDDDEVCTDDLDELDKLQNEYECLFNDFEKLRHRCMFASGRSHPGFGV